MTGRARAGVSAVSVTCERCLRGEHLRCRAPGCPCNVCAERRHVHRLVAGAGDDRPERTGRTRRYAPRQYVTRAERDEQTRRGVRRFSDVEEDEIRRLAFAGATDKDLAVRFEVSPSTIANVVRRAEERFQASRRTPTPSRHPQD